MDYTVIFNHLQNLGLRDLTVSLRDNIIYFRAMNWRHKSSQSIDFLIIDNDIVMITDIYFRFGIWHEDTEQFDEVYSVDESKEMSLDEFLLLLKELTEKYGDKIKNEK